MQYFEIDGVLYYCDSEEEAIQQAKMHRTKPEDREDS
jgi:hypothetical protein